MRHRFFLSALAAMLFIFCAATPDRAHAISYTEKTAKNIGATIGFAEYCQLSGAHRQLMWTEAYSQLAQSSRNDRELKRAKETLQENYEKNRSKNPKGGCRAFMANNPDPTIQTMKTIQQLQKKVDTFGKIMIENQINTGGQMNNDQIPEKQQ